MYFTVTGTKEIYDEMTYILYVCVINRTIHMNYLA